MSIIYYESNGFKNQAKTGNFLDIDDSEIEIHSKNIHKNTVIHDNNNSGSGDGDSIFKGDVLVDKGLNVGYYISGTLDDNYMLVSRTDEESDKNNILLHLYESITAS